MQNFTVFVPARSYLGTVHFNNEIEESRFFTIGAASIEDMRLAANVLGPEISKSKMWTGYDNGDTSNLSELFEKHGQKEDYKNLHRSIIHLFNKVANDLGSVNITRFTLEHSNTNYTVVRMRIEAEEGARRRVVYMKPNQVIEKIAASEIANAVVDFF